MRERWDEAINKIDEKYIAEAAQTHAKHAEKQREAEQFEAEGEHPTAITTVRNKKSGKGKIIGFCAAAAAVALVAIGGGVMMGRDDSILTGDTTTEATIEATVETDETSEQIVITEREFTHLDLDDYSAYSVSRYNVSVEVTEYMLEGLNEAVSGFAKNEPVDSIARDEAYSAALRLYKSDTVDGHYDQLRLHKTIDAPDSPLYYYSLSDTNITTYFEISEQSYDDMSIWLASYAPDYINAKVLAEDDLGNVTRPEDGIYYVQDSNGGVYSVNFDERFAVGDTLRVWFYGGVMETYPAGLNEIKAERIYDIASDENTLILEGMELSYDPDVFEEYFLGEWKRTLADFDWTHTFDYNSDLVYNYSCGVLSDGYYLFYYSGGQPEFFFIPKEYPHSMFRYSDMIPSTHKRNSRATEYIFCADIGNTLSGALNYMGEIELLTRMGDNFPEIYNSLLEGFTDNEGRQWSFARGDAGTPNDPKVHLKDYSQGGISTYAEIFMEYYDPATFDQANNAETRWYSHFIQKTENHYYELIATLPCDENGNVYPDSEYKSFSEDDLYGHDVTAGFSWAGNYENIVYPQVYVADTNTRKVLAQTELVSPAMSTYGGSILGGTSIIVQDVPLESGAAFAVLVPVGYNEEAGEIRYYATFYSYDKINKEISLLGEDGLFRECMNADITTDRENNLVKILTPDHALEVYRIDLRNNTVELIESGNEDGTFEFDLNNGGTGKEFEVFSTAFAGEWISGSEKMELDLYSDMFSYSDHAWFYEDNSGYFMMANSRLWFVPVDNRDAMYYYEGLAGSGTLAFDDADKVYSRSGALEDFYGGEGEMGWFGLLNFLYTADDSGVTVDELFDMEITDENGNVWVRTPDRSIDWGGFYEGRVNGDTVYFLKMQSKNFPDTFKYFSFDFNLTELRNGNLVYSDVHYSFNMGVFDTNELASDYAAEAKADSDSIGYGCFIVDTNFYPLDNGGYYAVRMMGNNGAQWLSYGEVFYNSRDFDGVEGYEKVCETNVCDCVVSGNYLYRLYNQFDEDGNNPLWLAMYDDAELISDIKVDDEGFVAMDAYMELIGTEEKYILVNYYDSVNSVDRHALYETGILPDHVPAARPDEVVYNSDGSVTLTVTGGAVINVV